MLLEYPDHPRLEVKDFQREVKEVGVLKWMRAECKNQRWYRSSPLKSEIQKIKREYYRVCQENDELRLKIAELKVQAK